MLATWTTSPLAEPTMPILDIPRPQVDPAYTFGAGFPGSSGEFNIEGMRSYANSLTAEDILSRFPDLTHQEHMAPGIQNLSTTPVPISIFQHKSPSSPNKPRPIILHVHVGGQVVGNRFWQFGGLLSLLQPLHPDLLIATVEYRLAPEHPAPAAAHDVYAASCYLSSHAADLGINPSLILLHAISGGAAPAAAACLMAREARTPAIRALMLSFPMLDDRETYTSHAQFLTGTLWPGTHNRAAWACVLGTSLLQHRSDVSDMQVPGRAADLSNLPDLYVDVGECEVFRDSAVAFAARVLAHGGCCEVHVWPGMYHAASFIEPEVAVSKVAAASQLGFIQRALGLERKEREQASL